jgi:dipeptidyl aminopeptidase/acylaminoacyl peptidase
MSVKVENVKFPSAGNTLLGRIYIPEGRAKKPAVAICHGYPGNTKNMDLAEELALNGIVTLIFYYQGAWGSTGKFSFMSLETGAQDAVAYLRTLKYVDQKRIGLVSHSMGTLPLTKTMSLDPTIKTGILLAPADITALASKDMIEGTAWWFTETAKGRLTGVTVESVATDLAEVLKRTNPVKLVPKIKAPLMVVVGTNDTRTTPELCRRVYEVANEPKKWALVEGADHDFSDHRIPMIKVVLERLKETL